MFAQNLANGVSIGLEYRCIKENEQDLLNLPQKIAESKGIKIIICIDEFQNLETLSAAQLNLLIAIAKQEQTLTGSKIMDKYQLGTPQNVTKNKTPEGFSFLDPVFEYWFRKEYVGNAPPHTSSVGKSSRKEASSLLCGTFQ